jgi:signal peptidase II
VNARRVSSKWLIVCGIAGAVIVLDRLTKSVVASHMELHQSIPLIEGFVALTYVRNTGVAFGLFAGRWLAFRVPLLLGISAFAVTLLVWFLRGIAPERRLLVVACGAVLGGAIGNMIDRAAFGEVIDFVDFSLGPYHWPAFNVADAAITLGVAVLCFAATRQPAPSQAWP